MFASSVRTPFQQQTSAVRSAPKPRSRQHEQHLKTAAMGIPPIPGIKSAEVFDFDSGSRLATPSSYYVSKAVTQRSQPSLFPRSLLAAPAESAVHSGAFLRSLGREAGRMGLASSTLSPKAGS